MRGKKGTVEGIHRFSKTTWIRLNIDKRTMDRLDKIFDIYSHHDIHDEYQGIDNHHSIFSWKFLEGTPIKNKRNLSESYFVIKSKTVWLIILHDEHTSNTMKEIMKHFNFLEKSEKAK